MNRIILMFLFIYVVLNDSAAQTFQAGFYVGATINDVAGTNNVENTNHFSHLGFTGAGTVNTMIGSKTKLQMEIRFFQRGAQLTPAFDSVSNNSLNTTANGNYNLRYNDYFKMTLNYIDVVLGLKRQLHFWLRKKNTDRYGIEGGISVGALTGYSYEVQSINYTLDLNLIDISPFVGIYYNITPHFYVEGRYSNSVNSVLKHDASDERDFYYLYYDSWDAGHNVGFTLSLGFVFGNPSKQSGNSLSNNSPSNDTPMSTNK